VSLICLHVSISRIELAPGSYITCKVSNATSIYLSLRNSLRFPKHASEGQAALNSRQVILNPRYDFAPPPPPVSLLVGIDETDHLFFNHTGHGLLELSTNLDRHGNHTITIHLLDGQNTAQTVEFEGIWLSKGAQLISRLPDQTSGLSLDYAREDNTPAMAIQKHFELITDLDFADTMQYRSSWPLLLSSKYDTTYTMVPSSYRCLTTHCPQTDITLNELYFRSGPPGSRHFDEPYHFQPPYPSALVLDIGLLDFTVFLNTEPSAQALQQFTHKFVDRYKTFISTIRSTAYPYHSTSSVYNDHGIPIDSSFTYNSASSTLPVFLITPFTPSKRLHRLLSHAISQVVDKLQKIDGDKSTFWIDTSGWLTADDFTPSNHTTKTPSQPVTIATRTNLPPAQAKRAATTGPRHTLHQPILPPPTHIKVATYLSHHLCPYLHTPSSPKTPSSHPRYNHNSTFPNLHDKLLRQTQTGCPFNQHDNYLGHLYVPDEATVGRGLEDRKIQLLRGFLGME
jgi:hypothetical protein